MTHTRETPSQPSCLRQVCSWCGHEASADPFGSAEVSTATYGICGECVALLLATLPPPADAD